MRRSTKKLALSFIVMVSVFPFFTNCSEPMKSIGSVELTSSSDDSTLSSNSKTLAVTERALLASDQVLKSMSSVTGIEIDGAITAEYSKQQDVLSGSFNLDTVTPPMLIGITNLAARFCSKLVTKEAAITAMASRRFFQTIPFATKPEALTAGVYAAAVQSLAKDFWGRDATSEELVSLNEARTNFLSGRDAAKATTSTTNALMVLVCTGMLASFESYTF